MRGGDRICSVRRFPTHYPDPLSGHSMQRSPLHPLMSAPGRTHDSSFSYHFCPPDAGTIYLSNVVILFQECGENGARGGRTSRAPSSGANLCITAGCCLGTMRRHHVMFLVVDDAKRERQKSPTSQLSGECLFRLVTATRGCKLHRALWWSSAKTGEIIGTPPRYSRARSRRVRGRTAPNLGASYM